MHGQVALFALLRVNADFSQRREKTWYTLQRDTGFFPPSFENIYQPAFRLFRIRNLYYDRFCETRWPPRKGLEGCAAVAPQAGPER
jgi:hypothetical protein